MTKKIFSVGGMTCGHCEETVKKAALEIIGVSEVIVKLECKEVTIVFDDTIVEIKNISKKIEAVGFEVINIK